MAAFCTCCGAEITKKAKACPDCGTPQHGMSSSSLGQQQFTKGRALVERDADHSAGESNKG
jgi:predicted amidophosphoribosyltransferase